jgi:3-methyl-2-oxobutanoate hydroxymethyltransferase
MMFLPQLLKKTDAGEKLAVLTCYDASFASLMARAGVDIVLVGD